MKRHASDCAMHNAPAMQLAPCDCAVSEGAFVKIKPDKDGEHVHLWIGGVKVRRWPLDRVHRAEQLAQDIRGSIGADRAKHKQEG